MGLGGGDRIGRARIERNREILRVVGEGVREIEIERKRKGFGKRWRHVNVEEGETLKFKY